jgi:hypothetical protein
MLKRPQCGGFNDSDWEIFRFKLSERLNFEKLLSLKIELKSSKWFGKETLVAQ